MDKFGIFNLLNSFFSLNSQKNEKPTANSTTSGLANNLLSSLGKNLLSSNSWQSSEQVKPKETQNQTVPLPLQKSMLLTINSHDEIVKRVKEKHSQPK
ncbi:MAG: hypothetical protein E7372_01885 [Clostridiales bacterium]|nr:hypothetical protein [Clostridiales bacterium]